MEGDAKYRIGLRGYSILLFITALILGLNTVVPWDSFYEEGGLRYIVICSRLYHYFVFGVTGAFAIALLVTSGVCFYRMIKKQYRWISIRKYFSLCLGLAVVSLGGMLLGEIRRECKGVWEIDADVLTIHAQDRTTYRLLKKSPTMISLQALVRDAESKWYGQRFQVLSIYEDLLDGNYSVLVVRTTDIAEGPSNRLCITENGWVVALCGNYCSLAYDVKDKRGYGYGTIEDDSFPGSGIKAISPFVLVGRNSKMKEGDIEELFNWFRKRDQYEKTYPDKNVLARDLNHPNGQVRKLARKLLEESE